MPAADQELPNEPWRDEVASRVNSYRRRQKRKIDPESSLRLDFEAQAAHSSHAAIVQAVAERVGESDVSCDIDYFRRTNQATAPAYEPVEETEPTVEPETHAPEDCVMEAESLLDAELGETREDPDFDFDRPRIYVPAPPNPGTTDAQGNVIVFPKQPTYQLQPPVYELAEPVMDRPRILDVPEEAPMPTIQGPLFADIELDAEEPEPMLMHGPVHIDVPLQVAMVGQRLYAAVVDFLFVMVGFGVFSITAWRIMPDLPNGNLALAAPVMIFAILWLAFQYMFITYAGETPGMQIANMQLVTFEGERPNQQQRRQRALSMIVSLISGGVGFGWALLDPDTLCWHDSISRTYVTQQQTN
jgi:uncharacterized RDD family membrane protein YckC